MKLQDLQDHLQKVKTHLSDELAKVRTGRASANVLDAVKVAAYDGSDPMYLKELASITVPDSQSVLVAPWDKSLLAKIEEAVRKANLGLNPINEGEHIRIPVPPLTEERRKELAKHVSALVEQSKISIRTIRQNAIKAIEETEENGVISEDEMTRQKKQIEEKIAAANKDLELLGEVKQKELMTL